VHLVLTLHRLSLSPSSRMDMSGIMSVQYIYTQIAEDRAILAIDSAHRSPRGPAWDGRDHLSQILRANTTLTDLVYVM
jgi:hypothetical protein